MERPVLAPSIRIFLVIVGLGIVGLALLTYVFVAILGIIIFCVGAFVESEEMFEPPFWKIRWHQFWMSVRKKDTEDYERDIADWKLEIEKRLSRIAELERDKQ